MNRKNKVIISSIVTIAVYVGVYFLLISGAPEVLSSFYVSVIMGIVALGIGAGINTLGQKKGWETKKTNIAQLVAAGILWLSFGWLVLLGQMVGQYLTEKE